MSLQYYSRGNEHEVVCDDCKTRIFIPTYSTPQHLLVANSIIMGSCRTCKLIKIMENDHATATEARADG